MTARDLDRLLAPRSVVLVGASTRPGSVGTALARNLREGGFAGPIRLVNRNGGEIGGEPIHADLSSLPESPDLAVIATPPESVPELVRDLAKLGCGAAVIVAALPRDGDLRQRVLQAAGGMRLLGAESVGLQVPGIGLNASLAHLPAAPGRIACLTQSGAVGAALIDWAASHRIGFSHLVAMGAMMDVDFGDMIDHLAVDPEVRSIVLHVEALSDARKFMSAARAAARVKPLIVIKAGRHPASARAAGAHSGALAGADMVYDAAFRRAGMLRVGSLDQLFHAVETLALSRPAIGERLAILTNGGGMGVLAADSLLDADGTLAQPGAATRERLAAMGAPSDCDPVDIGGHASPEHYAEALDLLLADPAVDAVVAIHCPTALTGSAETAEAVVAAMERARSSKPVLAAWAGERTAAEGRRALERAGLPSFAAPEEAVAGFGHLVRFRRNQAMLLEVPPDRISEVGPDRAAARRIIAQAKQQGRDWLDGAEAMALLTAYGIPVMETRVASDALAAGAAADRPAGPFALKIRSPDILHKSDVGGVMLDLADADALVSAARAMAERVAQRRPDARIEGFLVQPMAHRDGAIELIAGIAPDPVFGPVVVFGQGGLAVEVIGDMAVALPPLNATLAAELVGRTRVSALLGGFRTTAPVDRPALEAVLVRLGQLAGEQPEIAELDINPLLASSRGMLALDARVRLQPAEAAVPPAILSYPSALEQVLEVGGGLRLRLRPIRPDDAAAIQRFVQALDPVHIQFRFFSALRRLPPQMLARLTQIDYHRDMAFLAFPADGGTAEVGTADGDPVAVVRVHADPGHAQGEFAIVVAEEWQGRGIGRALMRHIIEYARSRGMEELFGYVHTENRAMLDLVGQLGFELAMQPDEPAVSLARMRL